MIVYPTSGGMSIGKTIGASGYSSLSIGENAGLTSQGDTAIAIGLNAGKSSQEFDAIAIGNGAASSAQGPHAIAIGKNSGTTTQGTYSVAIGHSAGNTTQGTYCVAVGQRAGYSNQGSHCIAIGSSAGETSQHANTIILNAKGTALNSTQTNSLYINPIRNTTTTPTNVLTYNTTTKEVSYGPLPTSNSGPAFNAYQNTSQSLTALSVTSQPTKLVYQVEEYNIGSCFNNNRFTPNVPGLYLVQASIFTSNRVVDDPNPANGSWFDFILYKNGNAYKSGERGSKASTLGYHISNISLTLYLNGTTDYIEMYTSQSSTIPSKSGSQYTWFSGCYLRGP
jgi:hypothetical protein